MSSQQDKESNREAKQEKKGSVTSRRQLPGWLWLLLILLCGIAGGAAEIGIEMNDFQITDTPTQIFQVTGQPQLVIQADVGLIAIGGGGEQNTVIVNATKESHGFAADTSDSIVEATQHGNTITVIGRAGQDHLLGKTSSVSLYITAPTNSILKITAQAAGVYIDRISGQYSIEAQTARVSIGDATLQGQSRIQTTSGTIDFQGTLDPHSSSIFQTGSGNIDITLPADAAFNMKAEMKPSALKNAFGSNELGPAPQAQLDLNTRGGQAAIHKGA